MAKTPKLKKRDPSLRSRAPRRNGTSPPPPSLAVDPKTTSTSTAQQPWLSQVQNGGISKRRKTKVLSRQQRARQQKGMEHAARNVDRLEKKVQDSKRRARKVRDRRAEWEELNEITVQVDQPKEVDEEEEIAKPDVAQKSWTDKMVEVELQEAMHEIEDFALPLPNLNEQPAAKKQMLPTKEGTTQASRTPEVGKAEAIQEEEIDEIL